MSRRAIHWLVLCFTTVWFAVLVPVHNRGEIRLPGATPAQTATAGHCHQSARAEPTHPCHDPSQESRGSCAVCYFIATLDAPPPVTLIEVRLGLLGATDAPRPDMPVVARVHLPFHSRGPPTA